MTEEQLAACAAKIGLAFPPGTRGLGLRETSGLDDSITLKVEIPSDQWTRFVEHSPFQSEEFTEDRRYLLGPDEDWWDPGTPTALPTAQVYGAPGRVLNMGADRSDPKKVIAYLFWHET